MNDVEYLKQSVVRDMVSYVMEDDGVGIEQAMPIVAKSNTMSMLLNDETGLYRESSAYVHEYLKEERGGRHCEVAVSLAEV